MLFRFENLCKKLKTIKDFGDFRFQRKEHLNTLKNTFCPISLLPKICVFYFVSYVFQKQKYSQKTKSNLKKQKATTVGTCDGKFVGIKLGTVVGVR